MNDIYDLIIVGAGAAGLMAAAEAGALGFKAVVLESQREPGLKILMSGGGRCNATNARVTEKDYAAGCEHTLRHVLKTFSSSEAVAFFEQWGAPLSLQETGEYFSADNKARTVRDALLRAVSAGKVEILCQHPVKNITVQDGLFNVVAEGAIRRARAVVVTTGGLSYPSTGSSGAGYALAESFGHQLVSARPALTPFLASRDIFATLSGIAVPVRLSLWALGRKLRSVEGPMLFTHNGFSGPAPMEISCPWIDARNDEGEIRVDFFPTEKGQGIGFILDNAGQQNLKNLLARSLTERLALVLLSEAKVDGFKHPGKNELWNKEKKALERVLREYTLPVDNVMGYAKAEATAGGVDLKELKGATLESRLQPGLYFAGEVLDVNGRIGGFNLQWAWASAVAVIRAVAKKYKE
ncbi:MAG: aminoacetone oxidase family FAD-binding enzyme [Candidatus Omnitrophica bacterium]|nr:aminoacetone oxidase family FAD-binding enzyme [Candidatus Omnitrophota bacterium]